MHHDNMMRRYVQYPQLLNVNDTQVLDFLGRLAPEWTMLMYVLSAATAPRNVYSRYIYAV